MLVDHVLFAYQWPHSNDMATKRLLVVAIVVVVVVRNLRF